MTIIAIFGQRIERYKGQYAPELLEAVDECTNDDNGSFLDQKQSEYQKRVGDEFSFIRRMEFKIDDEEFNRQFYSTAIKATVVAEKVK